METGEFFTAEEKRLLFVLYRKLLQLSGETLHKGDCRKLKTHLVNSIPVSYTHLTLPTN